MNAGFNKKKTSHRAMNAGQALVETLLVLPLLVLFIVWSVQFFQTIHASHAQQKVLRFNVGRELNNQENFSPKGSLVLEFRDDGGKFPQFEVGTRGSKILVKTRLGLCQEMACR